MTLLIALLAGAAGVQAKVKILGFWWENPMPAQKPPEGLTSLSAKQCGACHQEIYQEWKASTHAHALSDLQYQAELKKSTETNWLCLNCHTPLENQLQTIAVGVRNQSTHEPVLRRNPGFDAGLRDEALTCAVCHVRDGAILGPYGDSNAPHPVKKDPRLLTEELCTTCHQATASYTDTLVCTFDTGKEWKASPYAAQGQSCSSCHMPAVERPVATGGPVRASRRHYFMGSLIGKTPQASEAEKKGREFYQSGLSVEILSAKRAGTGVVVRLKLKNARAGHLLPTGDPERFIRVDVKLRANGRVVASSALRIGQQWEWWPKARKLGDNRLKPLEERVEQVRLTPAAAGTAVEVVVSNCRLTEQNARFHGLIGKYPLEAVVMRLGPEAVK